MSVFPGAIDDISPAGKSNTTPLVDDHPNHHNLLADAIEKIERELGTDPSGSLYSDIASRFGALSGAGLPAPTVVGLTLKAAASQSANLIEAYDSAGQLNMAVNNSGSILSRYAFAAIDGSASFSFSAGGVVLITQAGLVPGLRLNTAGAGLDLKMPSGARAILTLANTGRFQLGASGALVPGLEFGSAGDTALYRPSWATPGTGWLVTDNSFSAGGVYVGSGATQLNLNQNGRMWFGDVGDVSIYRSVADTLTVDASLQVLAYDASGGSILLDAGGKWAYPVLKASAGQAAGSAGAGVAMRGGGVDNRADWDVYTQNDIEGLIIWRGGTGAGTGNLFKFTNAGLLFSAGQGGPFDVNLYRYVADNLKTDDTFHAHQFVADPGGTMYLRSSSGSIYFGTGDDVRLYRSAATVLAANGSLRAAQDLAANMGSASQVWVGHTGGAYAAQITFGSSLDTNLYRSAVNELKTDGLFWAAGGVRLPSGGEVVILRGEVLSPVGGSNTAIRIVIDGTNYKIPVYL